VNFYQLIYMKKWENKSLKIANRKIKLKVLYKKSKIEYYLNVLKLKGVKTYIYSKSNLVKNYVLSEFVKIKWHEKIFFKD